MAFLIDNIILGFSFALVAGVHPSAFFRSLDLNLFLQSPFSVITPLAFVLLLAMNWLYGAGFESSYWQATPGKRLLRIYVTDLHGRRVSFARALLRTLAKQISAPFFLGYFPAAFTARKQALHDLLASCLVLRMR